LNASVHVQVTSSSACHALSTYCIIAYIVPYIRHLIGLSPIQGTLNAKVVIREIKQASIDLHWTCTLVSYTVRAWCFLLHGSMHGFGDVDTL